MTKIGAQLPQHSIGVLELLGVGIALVPDPYELAPERIGLTQSHPWGFASRTSFSRDRFSNFALVGDVTFAGRRLSDAYTKIGRPDR